MKKRLLRVFVILCCCFAIFGVCACGIPQQSGNSNTTNNGSKQVPVYQGMSISSASNAKAKVLSNTALVNVANGKYGDPYGNPNDMPDRDPHDNPDSGWCEGDMHHGDKKPDGNNPYPENSDDETIENEIESSIKVVGAGQDIYYAAMNEDIYIYVHITNPDNYEILSFTLNGKKYSSYMFENGSDMETLILKFNVGSVSGIFEYTIDAIKYIDGTDIKDVLINGETTVRAGVRIDNQVSAKVSSVTINPNSISFNATLTDRDGLIAYSGGALKVALYDGDALVGTRDLQLGDNLVLFDNLTMNTLYQYAIVGYYDNLSGEGFSMNVLYKDAFYTETVVAFDKITVGQESINFSYYWNDKVEDKTITSLTLYKGSVAIKTLDATVSEINDLLSATEYSLVATYEYNGKTESISIEFATCAKAVPELSVSIVKSTQTSVEFDVSVTDNDSVGKITKVQLLHGSDSPVTAASTDVRKFENLLSDNAYTVQVTLEYDLNDGSGTKTLTKEVETKTLAKAVPELSVSIVKSTQTSVEFDVSVTDNDSVGKITKVQLLHGSDAPITAASTDVRKFENLLSDNAYTVRVTLEYDLNDGSGTKTLTKEVKTKTLSKAVPYITILNSSKTDSAIYADYTFTDKDNVGSVNSIKIYKGKTFVLQNQDNEIAFTNLDSYTEYKVVVAYSYNLNDGNGVQDKVFEVSYKTNPYLAFNSCKVINTSAVSEGETIYMQATLDNPSGALPSSVVVNGKLYNCASSTSANKLYIEILYDGQFEGGDTTLYIEKINMALDGATYSVTPNSDNYGKVFINGELSVKSIKIVNASNNVVEYCMANDDMYLLLTLNNKTGYTIDSVTINKNEYTSEVITELTKIDDNRYKINKTLNNGWNTYSITSVTYHNDYINKTLSVGDCATNTVYKTNSSTVTEISTVEQLMNTQYNGGYYKLTANMDLSGIEWTNLGAFNGVFDGNGYKILNMSNVSTITDTDVRIGLFGSAVGVLQNVTIEDMVVMITLNSSKEDATYSAYVGCLASSISSYRNTVFLRNCEVSGDIAVINTTGGSAYVGGLFGYALYQYNTILSIDNCSVNVNVNLKNGENEKIGEAAGLVAKVSGCSELYVCNCTVSGSINALSAQMLSVGYIYEAIYVYENNEGLIYLNGVKTSLTDDGYFFMTDENGDNYLCDYIGSQSDLVLPDSYNGESYGIYTGAFSYKNYEKNKQLKSVVIPDGVTSIGERAFYSCELLESITIGESVTSIGSYAFYNCTALTEINYNATYCADLSSKNYVFSKAGQSGDGIKVTIGKNVKKIPALLFYSSNITSVVFEEGSVCESIGSSAFDDCKTLTSVTIGESVTSIGSGAFSDCSSLTSITIPDSVTSIGTEAFNWCYKLVEVINKSNLNITKGSKDNGYVAYYALNLKDKGASDIINVDDYLFLTVGNVNYLFGYVGNNTDLALPETYNGQKYEIYQYAFYNCTSLTSITIPDSVTSIGERAFCYCESLTSITIGESVTSIGSDAFYGCKSLTSITIGCSVTSIGNTAFYNCTALKTVYYMGTAEQWKNISIDYNNSYLTNATRYYYSETKPTDVSENYWHYDVDGKTPVMWKKDD